MGLKTEIEKILDTPIHNHIWELSPIDKVAVINLILAKMRAVVEGAKVVDIKGIAQKEIDRQIDFGYEPSYEDMVITGIEAQLQAVLKAMEAK